MNQGIERQIINMSRETGDLYNQGRYKDAVHLAQQIVDFTRTNLGEQDPHFADSLNNLAVFYRTMGDYKSAEPLFKQAVEILRVSIGEMHPRFADSLTNLAGLYKAMGNYETAEPLYCQSLEIYRTSVTNDPRLFGY